MINIIMQQTFKMSHKVTMLNDVVDRFHMYPVLSCE